jgi:hypothetical protein
MTWVGLENDLRHTPQDQRRIVRGSLEIFQLVRICVHDLLDDLVEHPVHARQERQKS